MSKAEKRALEAYPEDIQLYVESQESPEKWLPVDNNFRLRIGYQQGYEQAEKDLADAAQLSSGPYGFYYGNGYKQAKKDFITLVKQYIEKGERCMKQEGESQIYAFWDGFHNCAENILRELEDEK